LPRRAKPGTDDPILDDSEQYLRAREAEAMCDQDLGGIEIAGSPVDFGKLIAEETEKWAKVIRAAGIKAD
jgi:hypothetical protein